MNGEQHSVVASHLAYIDKQAKRFQFNLEKSRAGDVDAVHDLRVASRRLVEPMRLIAGWIGDKKVERVIDVLRRSRQAFRKVRDIDVVQTSLCRIGPTETLSATDLAQLEGVLTRKRQKSMEKARHASRHVDADKLVDQIHDLTEDFRESLDEDAELLVHQHCQGQTERWVTRVIEKDPGQPQTINLHETRLCVKRLRYSAELLRDLEGREEDALIAALAQTQEWLGNWNDELAAAARISGIARHPLNLAGRTGWSARLLEYAAQRLKIADDHRNHILENWPSVDTVLRARSGQEAGAESTSSVSSKT